MTREDIENQAGVIFDPMIDLEDVLLNVDEELEDFTTDPDEVEHQITMHAGTLPESFRRICAKVELVKKLLAECYVQIKD